MPTFFNFLGRLFSNERKMRRNAANWLELARHVWRYRRDVMTDAEAASLDGRREELRRSLREHADAGKLKLGIESLEAALRRVGGAIYPKSALAENAEFFLVAAIVILGIRAYFVQPFEIPTNSMWPSYYGMTAENFPPGSAAPGALMRAVRTATLWAWRKEIDAPASGPVSALFFDDGHLAYTVKNDSVFWILPTRVKEYTFYVGDEPATIRLPADFDDFDRVVAETFFSSVDALKANSRRQAQAGSVQRVPLRIGDSFGFAYEVPLSRTVSKGDPLIRFDLLTGDKLFVDRFSFNFIRPEPGEGMVFRTLHIPAIAAEEGVPPPFDEYYIKRLVGLPGDVIEIKEPALYRNGRPITGAKAFDLEAKRVSPYEGYFNGDHLEIPAPNLKTGETLTVPPHSFLGLGDHSFNSSDGRYWGFVPEKDLVGRPLFIYYPFTSRWGPAR